MRSFMARLLHAACCMVVLCAARHDASGQTDVQRAVPQMPSEQTGVRADPVALRQARSLRAQHKLTQADQMLRTFIEHHPADAAALTLLAEVELEQGDRAAAFETLRQALALAPGARETNDRLGQLLLGDKHYPEAMDRFETTLAGSPRDAEARKGELAAATALAALMQGEGHPEIALEVLEHARGKLPDDSQLLLELGSEAAEVKQFQVADQAYAEALRLSPRSAEVLYAMATSELEEQHLSAAEQHLRSYLALKPKDASAQFGLGHVQALESKTDEAREAFSRSIQLQPMQTESYYELGELNLEEHKDQEAAPLFQKTLARDPRHGGALTGMGIIAFRARKDALAEHLLAQAVQAAPDYQRAHYIHGLVLKRMGRVDEADAELARAVELDRQQQGPPGARKGAATADPPER